MQFGQVGELILLAPGSQVELGLHGLRCLLGSLKVFVERAGFGDHLDDLRLGERQWLTALKQPNLHAIFVLRVRLDFSLDLPAASQHDLVGPRFDRPRPEAIKPASNAKNKPELAVAAKYRRRALAAIMTKPPGCLSANSNVTRHLILSDESRNPAFVPS